MDPLSRNEPCGDYPQSWYAASTTIPPVRRALTGERRCDVAIVGAGYTGLSAALHLAEAGLDVVVLEANRVGWGASGRNGGQLVTGLRRDQDVLERSLGRATARALFALAEDAKRLVHTLCRRHQIACDWRSGYVYALGRQHQASTLRRYVDYLQEVYGYPHARFVPAEEMPAFVASPRLVAGLYDADAGHLHPLALALGIAAAAEGAGACIHERSPVRAIERDGQGVVIRTEAGLVRAEHAVVATNGYLGGLAPEVEARLMQVNSFVVTTAPLGEVRAEALLPTDACVTDDRFVVNYFRRTRDHRLLFGGGESYRFRYPDDIQALVRAPLEATFPQLKGVPLDHAWGGTLAITRSRLPLLHRVGPRVLAAGGYSGQGVALATLAGKLIADAIVGESQGFSTFAALPSRPFPGSRALRRPLLTLAMTWFALRDRLGR